MDNKKTPDEPQSTKRQSGHFLTVYIIGLFSVALVLILLSYLTQERSDQQLAALSNQLNEQTTAAQGAQKRIETLQLTVEQQQAQLEETRTQLAEILELTGAEDEAQVAERIRHLYNQLDAQQVLLAAMKQADLEAPEAAIQMLSDLRQKYAEALTGTAQPILTGEVLEQYQSLCARLEME